MLKKGKGRKRLVSDLSVFPFFLFPFALSLRISLTGTARFLLQHSQVFPKNVI